MSIRVRELADVEDYRSLNGTDKILISQYDVENNLITKNVELQVLDQHLSSQTLPDFNKVYDTLSGYALSSHTHNLSDISGLNYPFHKSDIEDFTHSHSYKDIPDIIDVTLYKENIGDFAHKHPFSDISDLEDVQLSQKNIVDWKHTHTSADIIDFSKHIHVKSQIVDFAHEHPCSEISDLSSVSLKKTNISDWEHTHETSDITDISNYITQNISGLTVPMIYDVKDSEDVYLSANSMVNSTPKDDINVHIREYGENRQRHFYLQVNNENEDTVVLKFENDYQFWSYEDNALDTIPEKSVVLLEFIETSPRTFFIIRHDAVREIEPAKVKTYVITHEKVDGSGDFIDSYTTLTSEFDEGDEFTFGESGGTKNDENDITGNKTYKFKTWTYDGEEYKKGQTFKVTKDATVQAVYIQNKTVRFYNGTPTDRTLIAKYRIEFNKEVYVEELYVDVPDYKIDKFVYPSPQDVLHTYNWENPLPSVEDVEDGAEFYCTESVMPYEEQQLPDDEGDPDIEKDGEGSDTDSVVLFRVDDITTSTAEDEASETMEYHDFVTDDDTFLTIV